MENTVPEHRSLFLAVPLLPRILIWVSIYLFILAYLHPELILTDSIPTGGDMASHYPTAVHFRDRLLEQGRIVGWEPGAYAGFPELQLYFPLPFLLVTLLSLVMPLSVAFKMTTVAGSLLLPWAAARFVKYLGQPPATRDMAAVGSLLFLFMEANSAWGGNLPSTLAGEFAYSLGLALGLIYLGRLYRVAPTAGGVVGSAALLALVGLAHGYALLFCGLGSSFFLLTRKRWPRRLLWLGHINLLAFCFMGVWLLPLLWFWPYTTPFNFAWVIGNWREIWPPILWPFIGVGLTGLGWVFFRDSSGDDCAVWLFLAYLTVVAAVFYLLAFRLGVVDVRFLPWTQLLPVLMGALVLGRLVHSVGNPIWGALLLAGLTLLWTGHQVTFIDQWARWNFEGWTGKKLWPAFRTVCNHLSGDIHQPRVAAEHSEITSQTGTLRAFELLPFFAGRATTEGVYIQASLAAPFVFYIQSEISREISAPLSQYNYSRFDLERARRHLALFNVSQYVTARPESFRAAIQTPGYALETTSGPFGVFRVVGGGTGLVIQPEFAPILRFSPDPKKDAFAWFRWADPLIPVVLVGESEPVESGSFAGVLRGPVGPDGWQRLPRSTIPANPNLKTMVIGEEIVIQGAVVGRPLWIKMSYHPNWRVEGAERVWRATPAFMLVFPRQSTVRLYFGRSLPDYLGLSLTILGGLWAAGLCSRRRKPKGSQPALVGISGLASSRSRWRVAIPGAVVLIILAGLVLAVPEPDPGSWFRRGREYFDRQDYQEARAVFEEALRRFPLSPSADQTWHHLALTWFRQADYARARRTWAQLEAELPESRLAPEARYHQGLCFLREGDLARAAVLLAGVTASFPQSPWADEAGQRLRELDEVSWRQDLERARAMLRDRRCNQARPILEMLENQAPRLDLWSEAVLSHATCLLEDREHQAALALLTSLFERNPNVPQWPEARYRMGQCRLASGDRVGAIREWRLLANAGGAGPWTEAASQALAATGTE